MTEHTTQEPAQLCYSYAHEDEALRHQLEKHLVQLQRQGLIASWHDRMIPPGGTWADEIDRHLQTASIVLLVVSPDFLASNYCYDIEMQRALERHRLGLARVVPIILRPCDWQHSPLKDLQCLPRDGKPVTQWPDQDEAFNSITQGLRKTIEQQARPFVSLSPLPREDRMRMLKQMRGIWIDGLLSQSLHDEARIELRLQDRPDVLANPWRLQVQELDQTSKTLPDGTTIVQVYDQADGELLILGEPGTGKTTLLLELTRTLLERAEQDERLRIPVVFNLSSWAEKRQPLHVWLAEELSTKYQVPRNLGRSWIENDQLLLLLDGLDEVTPAYRSSCIQALTLYRREHTLVPVVLCSRKAEYEAQSTRVILSKAVVIQRLTSQQIDDYLTQAGQQLEAVRLLLHEDQELQELARTPLMLTILTLTYQGKAVDDLTTRMPPDIQHVLGTYVERMLARRAISHYAPDQTKSWLVWLARQMVRHSQPAFYLEQVQPDWLDDDQSRQIYQRGVLILYGTLLGGIVGLLASSSVFSTPVAYFMGTLFFALAGTILAKQREATASAERGKYRGYICSGVLLGLGGVLSSLVTLLVARVSHETWRGVSPVWEGLNFALGGLFLNILLTGNFQSYPLTRRVARWGHNLWRRFSSLGSFLSKGQFAGFISGWGKPLWQSFRIFLRQSRLTRRIFWLWRSVQQRYLTREHIKHGLMIGLSITVVEMLHEVLRFDGRPLPKIVGEGIRYGLILGFAGIFLSALLEGLWNGRQKIHFSDIVVWSWKRCKRHLLDLNHIALGFLLALSVGLTVRLSYGLRGDVPGPFYGVNFAGLIFLNYWLLLGLFRGMARQHLPEKHRVRPNQGFWESARNSGLVGGISALVGGLSYGLTVVLRVGVGNGWLTAITGPGLAFSLAVGLLSGLLIGGKACLQHVLLRWLLWQKGSLPWNYPRFLDYATERILLRKVGGSYIFVHRFLLDHFASLHATSLTPQAAGGSGHVEACICGCPYRFGARFCTRCGEPRRETSTE